MKQTTRVLAALAIGLVAGVLALRLGGSGAAPVVNAIEPVGTIWINAVRMTVVPLVVSLIIGGIAGGEDLREMGAMGRRMVVIFLVLLAGGALLSIAIALPSMQVLSIPADAAAGLQARADASASAPPLPSLVEQIVAAVPTNPVAAAASGAMLPLVVFSILFAFALVKLDVGRRQPIVAFFKGVAEVMLVLVGWVLAAAPIGIFALAVALGYRVGINAAGAIVYYMAVLAAVLLLFTLLLYPLAAVIGGVPLRRLIAAAVPAQGIALSSRSSLSALPAVLKGTREHLGASAAVTGFAIPLAVSVFRVNVPMAWVVGVLFLGKLYGVEISLGEVLMLAVTASLISFSVPGVPSASLFLLAPVLVQMGIPAQGAGVLIAVDAIPDMFKTLANVTSHVTVGALLGRRGSSDALPPAETA
jgi:Na+/H+-dicarboxylate symporter